MHSECAPETPSKNIVNHHGWVGGQQPSTINHQPSHTYIYLFSHQPGVELRKDY